jgi:hypothetical protein
VSLPTFKRRRYEAPLRFDHASGRFVIASWELHCGDCFAVLVYGGWKSTRIEMAGSEWYLVGVGYTIELEGMEARSHE